MSAISKLLEAKAIFEQLFDKEINNLTLNLDLVNFISYYPMVLKFISFIMIMVNTVIISYFPSLI